MSESKEQPEDYGLAVYLSRADANSVADFLDAYGEGHDREIAASIRSQVKAHEKGAVSDE